MERWLFSIYFPIFEVIFFSFKCSRLWSKVTIVSVYETISISSVPTRNDLFKIEVS